MKYTILTGAGYDKLGHPIGADERDAFASLALKQLAIFFGGGTITPTKGSWKHASGRIVVEDSLKFEVFTDQPRDRVEAFARWVCFTLRQEAVVLTAEPVNVEFLSI